MKKKENVSPISGSTVDSKWRLNEAASSAHVEARIYRLNTCAHLAKARESPADLQRKPRSKRRCSKLHLGRFVCWSWLKVNPLEPGA